MSRIIRRWGEGSHKLAFTLCLLALLVIAAVPAYAVDGDSRETAYPAETTDTADAGQGGSGAEQVTFSQSVAWDTDDGAEPGDATLTLSFTGTESNRTVIRQYDYALLIDCSLSPNSTALWQACVQLVEQIHAADPNARFYVVSENGAEEGVDQLYAPQDFTNDPYKALAAVSKIIYGIYGDISGSIDASTKRYWNPEGAPGSGALVSQDYVLPALLKAQNVHNQTQSERPLMAISFTDGDHVYAPQDMVGKLLTGETETVEWRGHTYKVTINSEVSDANVERQADVEVNGETFQPVYAGYLYGSGSTQGYYLPPVGRLDVTVTKDSQPYTDDQLRADFGLPEFQELTDEQIAQLPDTYQMMFRAYDMESSYLPRFAMNLLMYGEYADSLEPDTEITSLTVMKSGGSGAGIESIDDLYSAIPASAMAKYFCTDEDHYFEASSVDDYSAMISELVRSMTVLDSMSVTIDANNFMVDTEALDAAIAEKGRNWSYTLGEVTENQNGTRTQTLTIGFPAVFGGDTASIDIPLRAASTIATEATSDDTGTHYVHATVDDGTGHGGSAWTEFTNLSSQRQTVEVDPVWLDVYELTYVGNPQQDGTVTGVPSKSCYPANGATATLVTEPAPTHTVVDGSSVVFLGWTAKQTAQIYEQADESPETITTIAMDADKTVYAAWGCDRNDDEIPDVRQITITPADIIIYMGGELGNQGTVNDDGVIEASTSLPDLGFVFTLPGDLQAALDADKADATAVTFTGDRGRKWSVQTYPGLVEGSKHPLYTLVPAVGQDPVRVQFTNDADENIVSDEFEVGREVNTTFPMSVYKGSAGTVTAHYGDASYQIALGEGTLSVRGTTDTAQYAYINQTGDPAEVAEGGPAVRAPEGTVFSINGGDVKVQDTSGIALLFDDIINTTDLNRTRMLQVRAENLDETGGLELPGDADSRSYEFKYLDLVDTNDGNAWVAAEQADGAGQDVTVYWPLPVGTNSSTDFSLIHFKGLDRDMEAEAVESSIASCEVEAIKPIQVTDTHVVFTVAAGDFSPFALVWSTEPGKMTITKAVTKADDSLTPDSDATFTFGIDMSQADGTALQTLSYAIYDAGATQGTASTLTFDGNGHATVPLKAGQRVVLSGIPAYASYDVYELRDAESMPGGFAVAQDTVARWTGVMTAGSSLSFTATNHYSVTPATVTPTATKTLNDVAPGTGEAFTFTLSSDAAGEQVLQTKQNDANGDVVFDALSFSTPDTYTYYVRETGSAPTGYTYDSAAYRVTYTVTDNGAGALFVADTSITRIAEDGVEAEASAVTFSNAYHPLPTSATAELSGKKNVNVVSGDYVLSAGDFSFQITGTVQGAPEGSTAPMPSNAADGVVESDEDGAFSFGTLSFAEPGTYTYTVSEIQPTIESGEAIPGISYDGAGTFYTLRFVVEDVDGQLEVTDSSATKLQGGQTSGAALDGLDFTNSYDPAAASIVLGGTKQLSGRAWEASDEFTFELLDSSGTVIDTARATASSPSFTFGPISYEETGEYQYTIREVTTGLDSTLTSETEPYTVTVDVTDKGGALTATPSIANTSTVFVNSYTPTPVTLNTTIAGTKTLTCWGEAQPLQPGEFSFQLLDSNGDELDTATNDAGGVFVFDYTPTYTEAGTYTYTVREALPAGGVTATGVTYDTTVYTVTVSVAEDRSAHALTIEDVAYSTTNDAGEHADAETLMFENTYAALPTSVGIVAGKTLVGAELSEGAFDFELVDAEGVVVRTATNNAQGGVTFDPIVFERPGTYTYTIREVAGDTSDVTYDDASYEVTVSVSDAGTGALSASVSYQTQTGEPPVFVNSYHATTTDLGGPNGPSDQQTIPGTGDRALPWVGGLALVGLIALAASRAGHRQNE